MKTLIIFAIAFAAAYFGHKRVTDHSFTEKDFLQDIEESNKKLPKALGDGIVLEKLEVEGKMTAIARVTVPVILHKVDTSRIPELKLEAGDILRSYTCTDKIGRYLLDNGVKFKYIFEDKTGHLIMDTTVSKTSC